MKKIIIAAVLACVFLGSGVLATTASPSTTEALQSQINALLQQIAQLQAQIAQLQGGTTQAWCHTFNTNLRYGDSGTEVSALITALIKEGFLASEEFGNYTEKVASAVVEFQEKYASEILTPLGLRRGTGVVASATRTKLNKLYGCAISACGSEGGICGGIMGKSCCSGLKCVLTGNYPDAGGICKKEETKSCTDTDGGLNYDVKGTVTYGSTVNADVCSASGYLFEQKCINGIPAQATYMCPNGCSDGACLSATSSANCQNLWWYDNSTTYGCTINPKQFCGTYIYEGLRTFATYEACKASYIAQLSCTDSDGINYYLKGTVTTSKNGANVSVNADSCSSGNYLLEQYCDSATNLRAWKEYQCPNGCSNGACLPPAGAASITLSNMRLDKTCYSLSTNEPIKVTITATNYGGASGSKTVALSGAWNISQSVTLAAGETKEVVFSTKASSLGDWTVKCAECTGTNSVTMKVQQNCSGSVAPSITVISPNGGEKLQEGSYYTIKWNALNLPSDAKFFITIFKEDNSGQNFQIVSNLPSTQRQYSWVVTSNGAWGVGYEQKDSIFGKIKNFIVRIFSAEKVMAADSVYYKISVAAGWGSYGTNYYGLIRDTSDNNFTITAGNFTCTDSDGGDNYYLKGTVTYGSLVNADACSASGYLFEQKCMNGAPVQATYLCPNNCSNGACLAATAPSITSMNSAGGTTNDMITIYGKNLVDTIPSGITIEFLKNGVQIATQRSGISVQPDGLSLKFQLSGLVVENIEAGTYQIRVVNDRGTSNALSFIISKEPLGIGLLDIEKQLADISKAVAALIQAFRR